MFIYGSIRTGVLWASLNFLPITRVELGLQLTYCCSISNLLCDETVYLYGFIFLFFFFLLKDWNDILKEALGKPSADSYYGTEGTINGWI